MRVLVFGGTGLLGAHLVTRLRADGHDVAVASRRAPADPALAWQACDIGRAHDVQSAFDRQRPEVVVHLAAALQFACQNDPALAVQVNVAGTNHVLQAARASGTRHVLFASSQAAYGESSGELTEDTPPSASTSLYGRAKWLEEQLGEAHAARGGLRFTALRFAALIGLGDVGGPGMASVRKAIERTRLGTDVDVPEAGGDEKGQLTHVDDAVDATLALMHAPVLRHRMYNVAGPAANHLSLRDYHAAVCRLFPAAGRVHFSGRARSLGSLSTQRLQDDTGWRPRVSVDEALRRMYGAR